MFKKTLLLFFLIFSSISAYAQAGVLKTSEDENPFGQGSAVLMQVFPPRDTTYFMSLDPVWVFPKGKGIKQGDWREYYRLVYNFNKVYPYALVGRKLMAQVDSTLKVDVSKRSQRNQYINDVEKELLRLFEKDIRQMTITQGMVLMRLVDRECGLSPYEIIQTYEGNFAAGFWQLVAKIFSHDLKTRFDPSRGEDARIDKLCEIWDSGQWDSFYFSIFYDYPQRTIIKAESLQSFVKKK